MSDIDDNIPIPPARGAGRHRTISAVAEKMRPGQSRFFDRASHANNLHRALYYIGAKAIIRKVEDDPVTHRRGWRVWKV